MRQLPACHVGRSKRSCGLLVAAPSENQVAKGIGIGLAASIQRFEQPENEGKLIDDAGGGEGDMEAPARNLHGDQTKQHIGGTRIMYSVPNCSKCARPLISV
jgi:hypothetical protein